MLGTFYRINPPADLVTPPLFELKHTALALHSLTMCHIPEGTMKPDSRYSLAEHKVDSVLEILRGRSQVLLRSENDLLLKGALDDLAGAMEELRAAHDEVDAQRDELVESALRVQQEHQRYVELFEDAPDGYVVTDLHGVIRQTNRSAVELLESVRDFIVGKPLAVFVTKGDRTAFYRRLNEMKALEAVRDWELRFQPWKGKVFWASVSIAKVQVSENEDISLRWLIRDITQRKRNEEIIQVRLNLLEFATSHSTEELLQKTLDEIGQFTNSPIGFLHFVESDQKTLSLQAWSTRTLTEFCTAEGKGAHYPIEKAGVWVDCVHEKRPVIHNDYSELPHRKGLPDGHPPVIRELVVPIMRSNLVVAILGIGNKPEAYTQEDIEAATYLADMAWEIAERKRIEGELRENQSRLDLALRSVHMGAWRWDIVENRRWFDDQVCRLLGINPAEFTGTADEVLNVIHPDDRPATIEALARAIEHDGFYDAEYRVVHPDSSIHYLASRGRVVRDDNGRPARMNGIIWDITERKRLEEKAAHLAAIVESSDDAIIGKTLNGKIISWNRAAEKIYGYTAEEAIGQSVSILLPEGIHDELPEILEKISRSELVDHYETRRRRKDGEVIQVSLSVSPIKDTSGKIIGASTIPRDITEAKQIEEELYRSRDKLELSVRDGTAQLQKSEERIRAAFDLSAVGQAEFDIRKNRFQRVNQKFCEMTGYSDYELLEMNFSDLTHPEDRAEDIRLFEQVLSGAKREHSNRKRYICKDGSLKWVEVYAALLRDESGLPVSSIGVITDITKKKAAEDRFRAYTERLELLNQELQEFAFVASHDLQEPLRKIQTFCDMAKKRCVPVPDCTSQEYLDQISNSASRMRQLLRDLRLFSSAATKPEPFEKIDLVKIVREAVDVLEASAEETGCQIEIENMPAIEADESQMLLLFQNLIGNALKFHSGETPHIKVYGKLDRKRICEILVEDNGIGFDQQFAERIFKPFQRLHNRGEYDGTGMGLSICRKIVERHGGNIRAESEPGKGSTFIIRLPVKQNQFG
jgi:PAS domain S-box-containing protein